MAQGVQANMRLEENVAARIKVFADKYGIGVQDLIRLWVGQRLTEEESRQEYQLKLMELQLEQKLQQPQLIDQPQPRGGLKIYMGRD